MADWQMTLGTLLVQSWEPLGSYLHSLDESSGVPQQRLSQQQPQPGLALHHLVHIDVNIHGPVALKYGNKGNNIYQLKRSK